MADKDKKSVRERVYEIVAPYMGLEVSQLTGKTKLGEAGCDCISVISAEFDDVNIVAGYQTDLDEVVRQIEGQSLEIT